MREVTKSIQILTRAFSYGSEGRSFGVAAGYASSRNSQTTVLSYKGLLSYSKVGTRPRGLRERRDSGLW